MSLNFYWWKSTRSKIANGDEIWKPDALFFELFWKVSGIIFWKLSRHPDFTDLLGTTEARIEWSFQSFIPIKQLKM